MKYFNEALRQDDLKLQIYNFISVLIWSYIGYIINIGSKISYSCWDSELYWKLHLIKNMSSSFLYTQFIVVIYILMLFEYFLCLVLNKKTYWHTSLCMVFLWFRRAMVINKCTCILIYLIVSSRFYIWISICSNNKYLMILM